ncbi:MAG: hypothetical protein KBS82_05030 [Oscillospiraceae bacterium]|nr:hypothetical protein [Candidatus Limimonas egerieequi]
MGTNYYLVKDSATVRPPLHIGKASFGWKFIFRLYEDLELEGYEEEYFNSITNIEEWKSFLEYKTNGNYQIMTEHDKQVSFDDFWNMVEEKQKEKCDDEYIIHLCGYDFRNAEFS